MWEGLKCRLRDDLAVRHGVVIAYMLITYFCPATVEDAASYFGYAINEPSESFRVL
jgi:hypothetical protein